MKLSKLTLDILKNFSTINAGIIIRPGNCLVTKAATNSIAAEATIAETFPETVIIYDINQMLGTLSAFDDPDIEFGEKSMKIIESSNPNMVFVGVYGDPDMIITLTKKINMPSNCPIEFNLPHADFSKLMKMSGIQGLKSTTVTKNVSGKIVLIASDIDNVNSNTFSVETEVDAPDNDFKMIFSNDSLNLMRGDYSVSIASGIAKFVNQDTDLVYYIATLDKSYFK